MEHAKEGELSDESVQWVSYGAPLGEGWTPFGGYFLSVVIPFPEPSFHFVS